MLDEGKEELGHNGNNWNKVSRPFSLVVPRGSLLSLAEGHLGGPERRNYNFIACLQLWEHFLIKSFSLFSSFC